MRIFKLVTTAIAGMVVSTTAFAATSTSTFGVSATVAAECVINSASALAFGTIGSLTAAIDQTSSVDVTCTNTTPYNIGLDAGTATGATVTTRAMTGAAVSPETISYSLYSDSGRTTNWGNTVSTDTVAGTGNGTSQVFTVYGRIPAQTSAKPDTYSDTITVTVTY